jgi:hypothetical protein
MGTSRQLVQKAAFVVSPRTRAGGSSSLRGPQAVAIPAACPAKFIFDF